MIKRNDFKGQKMIVLPQRLREYLSKNVYTKELFVTDVGYYPNAQNHFRARKEGCEENILILCVDGEGWIELEGRRSVLKKNQYFIIPKQSIHKYAADASRPWTIYWIHFAGEKDDRFRKIYGHPHTISESRFARLEDRLQLFEELMVVLEEDLSDNNLEYSCILLTNLLGSLQYISQFRKINEVNQQDSISRSIRFMKNNLDKKLSLSGVAEESGLSVSHFSLCFKKQTSQSPLDYLTMLRVQKACNLLIFSSQKIKLIAREVGYDDPYYFSRLFTKYIGKSPRHYRQEERGE